jgi:hypothetical protein
MTMDRFRELVAEALTGFPNSRNTLTTKPPSDLRQRSAPVQRSPPFAAWSLPWRALTDRSVLATHAISLSLQTQY